MITNLPADGFRPRNAARFSNLDMTLSGPPCPGRPFSNQRTDPLAAPSSLAQIPFGSCYYFAVEGGMRVVCRSTICHCEPVFFQTCKIVKGMSSVALCAVTFARIVATLPYTWMTWS